LRSRVRAAEASVKDCPAGPEAMTKATATSRTGGDDLVELIETVVLYKLPRLSREEIQAMLQVHDIRETRVYQEAKEEGLKEGVEKGIREGIQEGIEKGIEKGIQEGVEEERQRNFREKLSYIAKMAAMNMTAA